MDDQHCSVFDSMSIRRISLSFGLAISLLFISGGCTKAPVSLITGALSSTNVVFKPNLQPAITLSDSQAQTIKSIIERFKEPLQVRSENDILPYESGAFILGNVHFGWLGTTLYIRDSRTERYYVVEDPALTRLSGAFFEAQGQSPPLRYPSQEEWQKILTLLDTGEHGVKR
jgi:hypothetical protein